jgi:hypothetical protein
MGKDVTDPLAEVAGRIFVVRGQRVMMDADLARLYGVSTKAFNQAVRRNRSRFPGDFLVELTNQEVASLRSQFVTLKTGRGEHRKYRQLAFTEHGAIMAATILNSPRAEQMSVYVVRAFVKIRESLAAHTVLARERRHAQEPRRYARRRYTQSVRTGVRGDPGIDEPGGEEAVVGTCAPGANKGCGKEVRRELSRV